MATLELGGTWKGLWISGLLGRFVLLCLGVWLHAADSLVTATVTPAIVDEIGGVAYVSWTILLYQIGAIVAGAATALLCQRVGVKRVQVVATLLYGIGCVIAATAPDMATLLGARLLQGIGGGMMVALSYVAIQQSFAEELWGRLFGIVAAIWGAGSLLGPLVGGVFADFGFWRGAFWFFAIQAGVLGTLALALLPAQPSSEKTAQKWPISPLLLLSAATLLIASAGVAQTVSLSVVECMTGVGLLYLAARLDRRSQFRMLPVQTLDLRHPISAGLLMIFALSMAKTGFWAYGPLILKTMFGIDPLISGYILAGEALAWSAATMMVSSAPISAAKMLIRTGMGLAVVGIAGFIVTVPIGSLPGMVVCGLLEGLGFGLSWPSIVRRIVHLSDQNERILAAAAPATVQRIARRQRGSPPTCPVSPMVFPSKLPARRDFGFSRASSLLWLSVSLLSGGSRQQKANSLSLHIRARAAQRSSRWHRSLRPASHRHRLFWRRARRWASDLSAWLAPAAAKTPAPSAQTDP
jgi:MFS family permease